MNSMFFAYGAIFFQFESIGGVQFVLLRDIIPRLAFGASENYMFPFRFTFFSHSSSPSKTNSIYYRGE